MANEADVSLSSSVRKEVTALLDGGLAHAKFDDAVKDFPVELRGVAPQGLPYSAWQIVEHIRIAQKDMLEFSGNADGPYQPMRWPQDYWPRDATPASEQAWDDSLAAIAADRKAFDGVGSDK